MKVTALGGKIIAALVLLVITFFATLLPYKLKRLTSGERCIKNISCFCGGLFMGLCFLHLIPDALKDFNGIPELTSIQKAYPLAELVMCVGMMIVMTAEKITTFIQNRNDERKCNNTNNCCKDSCKKQENSSLYGSLNKSYRVADENGAAQSSQLDADSAEDVVLGERSNKGTGERQILVQQRKLETSTNSSSMSNLSTSLSIQVFNNKETRGKVIKTVCLIIALMIHSLFEGLTVGLQKSLYGLVALVAVLAFHKGIIGFSLGLAIVHTNRGFKFHLQQAVLFALASPFGIMAGAFLLSTRLKIFDESAMAILICLATGTFLYITFFEILAKNLVGNQLHDLLSFLYFVIGFGVFAGLTAMPDMQT